MNRYTLIITEKPDAARRIACALDELEKPRKLSDNGVPYYVAKRDAEIVVVPALGHLYTIADELKGRNHYPVFNFRWVPRYVAERGAARIRDWLQTITTLAKNAEVFIDACDFDVEGCVIGYCILKHACGGKEHVSKRMKFSTLTKRELEKAYAQPLPHLDFGLIEAGLTRHEVDWLYGINLSRALTIATRKCSGKYATLTTGRVQGPTLKFLVAREEAIRSFVPTPYWKIRAQVEIDGRIFEARYVEERIENRNEAETIANSCIDKKGQVEEIEIKQFKQPPPFPFNLGTLQNEAYSLFRYTPRRTLNTAQQLYLDALISYPRTDSQRLPSTEDYRTILKNLMKDDRYSEFASELLAKQALKPNEGKKDDPAHPAIYPTGNLPRRALETSERKVWDLVVRRFMATFSEPAVKQNMKVHIKINGHRFHFNGKRILVHGWMHYYQPYVKFDEILLPPIKKGQIINVEKTNLEETFTEPPSRYNPSSLLKDMEDARIGTKATRADIMQTLCDRKYIEGEKMTVTSLGFEVFDVLKKHCPSVVSTALTRKLEEKMDRIRENRETRENVLADVIGMLDPLLAAFKKDERVVGEQLDNALERSKLEERIIGVCPVCKTGKLITNYSRKTGKRFIGCTNYFKGLCKTSFPLPQRGTIRSTGKKCPACGWPTVQVGTKRHSWVLCFNLECNSKTGNEKI
ncbi:MAG: DNA topoisomerase I [Candidatus Bathyarchaeia archaeon]|jgi:DNA topoisomerase-1